MERVGLWDGRELHIIAARSLTATRIVELPRGETEPPPALLIRRDDGEGFTILAHNGQEWVLVDADGRTIVPTGLRWPATLRGSSAGRCGPMVWWWSDTHDLEMASVGPFGTLYWAALHLTTSWVELVGAGSSGQRGGYQAAIIQRPGLVSGISPNRIDTFRAKAGLLSFQRSTPISSNGAAACFHGPRTGELIVVGAEGMIRRVPTTL